MSRMQAYPKNVQVDALPLYHVIKSLGLFNRFIRGPTWIPFLLFSFGCSLT